MKKNNYYTFIEIVTSLREEYLLKEEIIRKLNSYILSISNTVTYPVLYLDSNNKEKDELLRLNVSKKTNKINEIFEKISNTTNYSEFIYHEGIKEFIYQNGTFKPTIKIINLIHFNNLYQQLKLSPLYNLPSLSLPINYYQSLMINSNSIKLNNSINKGKEIILEYLSKEDILSIHSKDILSSVVVNELIETKIPKYEFSKEYYDLLENRVDKQSHFYVAKGIIEKNDSYTFKDMNKQLILTKRRR